MKSRFMRIGWIQATIRILREFSHLLGTPLVLVSTAVGMILAMVARVAYARWLGVADYGRVMLLLSITNLAATLSLLGLHQIIARTVSAESDDATRRRSIQAVAAIAILTSAFATLLSATFAPFIAEYLVGAGTEPYVLLFVLSIPAIALTQITIGIARGLKRVSVKMLGESVGLTTITLIVAGSLHFFGFGLAAVAIGHVFASYAVLIIVAILMRDYLRIRLIELRTSIRWETLRPAIPLFGVDLMAMLLLSSDTLILASLSSSAQVGYYQASFTVASLIIVILGGVGFLFLPRMTREFSQGRADRAAALYSRSSHGLALVVFPFVGLCLTAPNIIIGGIFGQDFVSDPTVLRILALGFGISALLGLSQFSIIAFGRFGGLLKLSVAAVALNVVVAAALVPVFGAVGAAAASAISFVSFNAGAAIALRAYTRVQPFPRDVVFHIAIGAIAYAGGWLAIALDLGAPLYSFVASTVLYAFLISLVFRFTFDSTEGIGIRARVNLFR